MMAEQAKQQSDGVNHNHSNNVNNILKLKEGGYIISLFVNKNKASRYQCGLCSQICCNAVELSCYECNEDDNNDDDKQYCELCLKTYLNQNNFTCPINKDHKNISYKTNSIQCQYIRDKVNNLIIYCPTSNHYITNAEEGLQLEITQKQNDDEKKHIDYKISSCPWKGKLNTLSSHLNNDCQIYEKPINCNYNKYGCNYCGDSKQLNIHSDENISYHMNLLCNIVDELKQENQELKAENKIFVDIIKASNLKVNCQLDAVKLEIQQQIDLNREGQNRNIMKVVNVLKTQMEYIQHNLSILKENVNNMQNGSKCNPNEQYMGVIGNLLSNDDSGLDWLQQDEIKNVSVENDNEIVENDGIYCRNYKNMILALSTDKIEIKQGLFDVFKLWEDMVLKNENELTIDKLKIGLKALGFFVNKVVKNPFMKQIRKINIYNKQYKERISVLPNIEKVFILIGYEKENVFWILPLLYDEYGENNDNKCKQLHDEQIKFLNGFKDVLLGLFNVENKYEMKEEECKNNIPKTQYGNRFMEIVKLIQEGKKPNDIQVIDDMPPDPNAPPSESKIEQKKKPFEMYNSNDDGITWFQQYEVDSNMVAPGGHSHHID